MFHASNYCQRIDLWTIDRQQLPATCNSATFHHTLGNIVAGKSQLHTTTLAILHSVKCSRTAESTCLQRPQINDYNMTHHGERQVTLTREDAHI